jgi:hypothetical protein
VFPLPGLCWVVVAVFSSMHQSACRTRAGVRCAPRHVSSQGGCDCATGVRTTSICKSRCMPAAHQSTGALPALLHGGCSVCIAFHHTCCSTCTYLLMGAAPLPPRMPRSNLHSNCTQNGWALPKTSNIHPLATLIPASCAQCTMVGVAWGTSSKAAVLRCKAFKVGAFLHVPAPYSCWHQVGLEKN